MTSDWEFPLEMSTHPCPGDSGLGLLFHVELCLRLLQVLPLLFLDIRLGEEQNARNNAGDAAHHCQPERPAEVVVGVLGHPVVRVPEAGEDNHPYASRQSCTSNLLLVVLALNSQTIWIINNFRNWPDTIKTIAIMTIKWTNLVWSGPQQRKNRRTRNSVIMTPRKERV